MTKRNESTDRPISFGKYLKAYRKARDMTQAELAKLVGYSLESIRKIESDQQRPSKYLAERLADKLALSPDEAAVFIRMARGLPAEPALPTPLPVSHKLPLQLMSFIGHEKEITEIKRLLSEVRLVTKIVIIAITVALAVLALAAGIFFRARLSEEKVAAINSTLSVPSIPDPFDSTAGSDPLIQIVNGIQFTATNFRREGSRLKADICFVLQDNSDWVIWKASLKYTQNGKEAELSDNYGSNPIELRGFPVNGQQQIITFLASGRKYIHSEPATVGQMGRRCDTFFFEVPAEADLSNFSLIIHSIADQPNEGETCDFYLNKVQKVLNARKTGIQLQCTDEPTGSGATVVSKPASMSQAEAEQIAFSDEFFTIKGPWMFAGSLK